jgi:alpha-tubulin suppressor-like RCC1 family protein
MPAPVEALRGVRVGSVAAGGNRNYAAAHTGQLWAWGENRNGEPLGHGERSHCLLPKPVESLRGVKVDAVAACQQHTLALADDGSVYAWGGGPVLASGALGLGPLVRDRRVRVPTPQRIPGLRVACGL